MKKETFWNKVFPWLMLVLVAALVYLPLAGQLGYYKDDWHVTWSGTERGAASIIDLHLNDRPGMGVVYAGLFAVLGNSPLNWQLYAFLIRVVGGCLFLWILWLINRDFKRENLLAALLFVVYPGFLQQPNASSYQCHLTGLAFGLFSIVLSLQTVFARTKMERAVLAVFSALSGMACYFMMEYMIGLEGLRLVLLVYLLYPRFKTLKNLLNKTLFLWLPNLVGLAAFLGWRLFFFKSARSVTDVGLLSKSYLADPFGMLVRFCFETLKSYINALLGAWLVPFYQVTLRAAYLDLAISLGLAAVVFVTVWFYWKNVPLQDQGKLHPAPLLLISAGLLGALLPIIPVILSYRQIEFQDTFDRYTLPASMGVMLVLIGLSMLINSRARLWI
ncbi:MAG: hypothetical protein LWX83_14085, partial [Anaerolineae bacterium]|nr:hypothetical protein [Anaerolineae bacterium]